MSIVSETNLSKCRKNLFAFVSLLIVVLSIYSNTFNASWHFDDRNNILENTPLHLTELNLKNIKKTFFADLKDTGKLYRPVACLSFALNYYFGQTRVFGYHLVNLIIHFLAAFFLYLFIYSTLNLPLIRDKYGANSYFISLLATILWTINPVQTQAVTYIVQRMASMAGLFYIAAMFFYLKGRTSDQSPARATWYILCFISGILALGSKENAIMLPISILMFDLFLLQGISKNVVKHFFLFLAIILVTCFLITLFLQGPSFFHTRDLTSIHLDRGFSLAQRLLTEPRVILFYISLLLYPMPNRLCLEHDIDISTGLLTPAATLIAILIILAILAVAVTKAKKWPVVSFCIIFFFLNHLIEGGIILLELVFEHRNYIPSMLLFVPISIILTKTLNIFYKRQLIYLSICIFIIFVIIGFAHSTFIRNFAWKNDESLYLDAIDKNPNMPRPYHNLANYYFKIGLKETALEYFEKSLTLPERPNKKMHHLTLYNIAAYYLSKGKTELARQYFTEAIRSGFPLPYLGLGILSIKKGDNDKGIFYLNKILEHKRTLLLALQYKGLALLKEDMVDQAIGVFKQATEIYPTNLYSLTHLGIAYKNKGKFGKAFIYFKRALNIKEADIPANLHIIELYQLTGHKQKAEQISRKLLDLLPDDKISTLIDSILGQGETRSIGPDLSIISPPLTKIFIEKSELYRNRVKEFNNRLKRESSKSSGKIESSSQEKY